MNIIEGGPYGSPWSPEAPPKAYRLSCNCPVWCLLLLGSQLGASPEPEPLGCGGLSHLRPCTSMPCLAVWLHACPFGREGGGCPALPLLKARPLAASGGCCRCALLCRLIDGVPHPPRGQACRWGPVARLSRGGGAAGVPWVASGASVPHPPAHCRRGSALYVLVCVAYSQPWQSWPSFLAPGPRASARQGEKGSPRFHSGTVQLLLHLVLWFSPGTLGQHRPRIKVHPVRSYAALRSCSPRAALALSRRWCCASCRLGLPLWLFSASAATPEPAAAGPTAPRCTAASVASDAILP